MDPQTRRDIFVGVLIFVVGNLILVAITRGVPWLASRALSRGGLASLGRILDRYQWTITAALSALMLAAAVIILVDDFETLRIVLLAYLAIGVLNLGFQRDRQRANMVKRTQANIQVWADREDGIATGIYVRQGDELRVDAKGLVSIDQGYSWVDPDGRMRSKDGASNIPEEKAYHEVEDTLLPATARTGMLVGWIGRYSKDEVITIRSKFRMPAPRSGELFLAINDVIGKYGDNTDGEWKPTWFMAKVTVKRL